MSNTDFNLVSLREVIETTSKHTGQDYLVNLVKHLSQALDINSVWITEFFEDKRKVRSLAYFVNGSLMDNMEYLIKGTPCETVIDNNEDIFHVTDNLVEMYPDYEPLAMMNARSYLGLAIKDKHGKVIGNMSAIDTKPMPELPVNLALIRIFADRAGAEMERMKYEEELLKNELRLKEINANLDEKVKSRTRDLKEAHMELDNFLYRSSHDMKGPITRMKGLINLLNMKGRDEYVEKINNEVETIHDILAELETVAFINNDELENELVNFPKLIDEIVSKFNFSIYDITLSSNINVRGTCMVNSRLVEIIVGNLLDNAIKFLNNIYDRSREIKLDIENDNDFIKITVSDNGEGIPKELINKVFDMFFRGSEKKGNGLGLYVIKQAVKRLKGDISIESERMKYTKVTAKFPSMSVMAKNAN